MLLRKCEVSMTKDTKEKINISSTMETSQSGTNNIYRPYLDSREICQLASFTLAEDLYVIDIMRIKQIIEPQRITTVRNAPGYLEGVIELRNTIVPIINLRKRLTLEDVEPDRYTKYIIVIVKGRILGIIVDAVNEIITIPKDSIKPAPRLLLSNTHRFYLGICNFDKKMRILLNLNKVGSDEDIQTMKMLGV